VRAIIGDVAGEPTADRKSADRGVTLVADLYRPLAGRGRVHRVTAWQFPEILDHRIKGDHFSLAEKSFEETMKDPVHMRAMICLNVEHSP